VQLQDSSFGSMIPIILGGDPGDKHAARFRLAGNVIYLSAVRKTEEITSGTGGGGGGGRKGGAARRPKRSRSTTSPTSASCSARASWS